MLDYFINIEELLTAADIAKTQIKQKTLNLAKLSTTLLYDRWEIEWRSHRELRLLIDGALDIIYSTLELLWRKEPREPYVALSEYLERNQKQATVITLNYDMFLEQALAKNQVHCDYSIDFNIRGNPSILISCGSGLKIYKLHGSLWWWDSSGQKVYSEKRQDKMDHVIIPPTALKLVNDPDIFLLWHRAMEAVREADALLVVGYSFGNLDEHFNKLIKQSVMSSQRKRTIILDPCPNKARLRGILGHRITCVQKLSEKGIGYCIRLLENP